MTIEKISAVRIMQDGRRITLSDQYLINIRNNLRKVIDYARKKYKIDNYDNIDKILDILEEKNYKNTKKIEEQERILVQENSALDDVYNKSILICGICKTLEGDRIYYKGFDKWYCPKCFEENYKHWAPIDWKPRYPLSKEQVLEFLAELEKVAGNCQTNLDLSKKILIDMDINKSDQKTFLETLYHYGGHCDCEIMLNAYPKVMEDFDLDVE